MTNWFKQRNQKILNLSQITTAITAGRSIKNLGSPECSTDVTDRRDPTAVMAVTKREGSKISTCLVAVMAVPLTKPKPVLCDYSLLKMIIDGHCSRDLFGQKSEAAEICIFRHVLSDPMFKYS